MDQVLAHQCLAGGAYGVDRVDELGQQELGG
jgi:hypothetical protein